MVKRLWCDGGSFTDTPSDKQRAELTAWVDAADYDKARDIISRLRDVRVANMPSDEVAELDAIYRDIEALDASGDASGN